MRTEGAPGARRRARAPRERYRLAIGTVALAVPGALAAVLALLAVQAWPSITHFGGAFLTSSAWDPVHLRFGALPLIYGTLLTSLLALLMAIPVGVGSAVFLAEPRARVARNSIGLGIEMLAAIPSVVYGLWALFVMAPFVYAYVETPLSRHLGFIPVLGGPPALTSLFTGTLVLAVMILPTISAVSREVVRAVPRELREASYALGATWWETAWRVVLPAARGGIGGAVILGLGRALGETIAITMVIGNRPQIDASWFQPAYTLASVIANEFTEATGRLYSAALIEVGLVLMLVTLGVNLVATLLVRSARARLG